VETEILPMYKKSCNEKQHYKNIEALVAYATKVGTSVLSPDGYRFGIAQKLLNLCLKYHWCLELVGEPPHCPVDRIVLDKTSFKGRLNWTEIQSSEKYREVIEEIDKIAKAKGLSIAMWELRHYARR
jgi:hypothetical protein